ncbi:DNA-directed RNA polymerase subunit beta' [Candidatus Microgenomates bacterium]|nr:DNA-directed RNA polymerase subunit beta' [Candidatus Microgenomates bacterium]
MIKDQLGEKVTDFDAIKVSLASPEHILSWSHGEVTKPETINYRTQKPEKDGLFCERIFGPTKDWECYCGKYKKIRYKGIICDKCGVQVTRSLVRRERMGHIKLATPVAHIWYLRGVPSRIGMYLGISVRDLEKVIYFANFVVVSVDEKTKQQILSKLKEEVEDFKKETSKEHTKKKNELEKQKQDLAKKHPGMDKKEIVKKVQGEFSLWEKEMEQKTAEIQLAFEEAKDDIVRLNKYAIISEGKYSDLRQKYGDFFKAGIGAEAILNLVKELDIKKMIGELEKERDIASGQRRKKISKRLRFLKGLDRASIDPAWMILTHVAVIPPDLRPMVPLDGGRFATSDINDLYRRVINRNNRLKRLQELRAPEVIQRNEKRMLQEAVDALIGTDSARGKTAVVGKKKLKSLSEGLKGKQGRFRQNLLGKRVDYSGRSVIVGGPDMRLDECGIPKTMALELFKPFIIAELIGRGFTHSAKSASKLIDSGISEVWDILEEITKKYYVLLNRAPTLHRLGIQAFKVKLIEGKAIRIHPLVCSPFNADFDGDQMAIHVPLSRPAQEEAANIMLSSKNLLKPSDGSPSVAPSQDIALGCYYLTMEASGVLGEGRAFHSAEEANMAYQLGQIHMQAKIKVRMDDKIIETTLGRIWFNQYIPDEIDFVNATVAKGDLEKIIAKSFKELGIEKTAILVDDIKSIGMLAATLSGISLSVDDLHIPENKTKEITEAERKIDEVDNQYKKGLITPTEKYLKNIEIWTATKEKIEKDLFARFDRENPVTIMITSKARGNKDHLSQVVAMRGLLQSPTGDIIDLPVKSNFKEGLTVLEYFISSHGARKGLADTALRTSDAGYLTRRLVDVAQDMIISLEDCGTSAAMEFAKSNAEDIDRDFIKRLDGRIIARDIVGKNKKILFAKGEELTLEKIKKIIDDGFIDTVAVKTALECEAEWGICQTCYGRDLARGQIVMMGEAVGIMAAQSIGEPGTQLTMRTFHSGGIAKRDITQGLPRVEELFEARAPKGLAIISEISGAVSLTEDKDGKITVTISSDDFKKDIIEIPKNAKILVKDGDKVADGQTVLDLSKTKHLKAHGKGVVKIDKNAQKIILTYATKEERIYNIDRGIEVLVGEGEKIEKGAQITEGHIDLHQLMDIRDSGAVKRYIVKEIQEIYESQGQSINDKHIEIIIRQMFSKVRITDPGASEFLEGDIVTLSSVRAMNKKLEKSRKKLIAWEELLLGVTKSSLNTDSFLSAASFQETTSVLIDAATVGKVDRLRGLKENTILGKLIPAGTGFATRRRQ